MADIFLSYQREDRELIRPFVDELTRHGFDVWWDLDIRPGSNWMDSIMTEIHGAKLVIVCWSKSATESAWVREEASYALRDSKYLGLMLDDVLPPVGFRQLQAIQFKGDFARTTMELCRSITFRPSKFEPGIHRRQRAPQETSSSKGYAFISYAEEDSDYKEDIATFLARHKYSYWDYESGERNYGQQTFREIEERIVNAEMVFSLLTKAWKASEWAVREYFFAKEIHKPIFLLRVEDPGPTLAVAGETYIDFVRDQHRGFNLLSRELDRHRL